MKFNSKRRAVVRVTAIAAAVLPLASILAHSHAHAQSPTQPLSPSDPVAKALEYITVSTKPDQKCGNCALYQGKAADAQGACTVFPGKSVASAGWCKSWAKKG